MNRTAYKFAIFSVLSRILEIIKETKEDQTRFIRHQIQKNRIQIKQELRARNKHNINKKKNERSSVFSRLQQRP